MIFRKLFFISCLVLIPFFSFAQDQDIVDVYSDTFGFDYESESENTIQSSDAIVLPTLNQKLLKDILRNLAKNKSNKVRAAVASNPYTNSNILSDLAKDKSIVVRIAAANNSNISQTILNQILSTKDSTMVVAVAGNPNTTVNDLASILTMKNPEALFKVYGNPSFPYQYLSTILKTESSDNGIVSIIATNSSLPESTLLDLSTEKSGLFVPEILYNTNAPVSVIISKGVDPFNDSNNSLVQSLLLNAKVSPNVKVELVDYLAYDVILGDKAKDANLSIDQIRQYSESTNPILRKQIAANISAPIDVLRKLSTDENEAVRINVAKNPSNSLGVLRGMMTDNSQTVRMALVMNEIISDTLLYDLYDDLVNNLLVNKQLRNILPDDITIQLINNQDPDIRYALALSPNASPAVLNLLSQDTNDVVREAVAVNKHTSPQTLNRLAQDSEINVRNGVVLNPNTPQETLTLVSQNPDNDEYLITDFLFNPNTSETLISVILGNMPNELRQIAENRWVNTPTNNYSDIVIQRMEKLFPATHPLKSGTRKDASAILNIIKNPKMPWLSIGTILYTLSDLDFSVPVFNRFTNYFYLRSTDKQIAQPGISKLLLEKMVADKNYLNKLVLAATSETEQGVLLELFETGDDWLKMLVASNPSIGTDYFKHLIDTSKNESVHCGLAQNPLMSVEDLNIFIKKFKSTSAKIGVASKGLVI